MVPFYILC